MARSIVIERERAGSLLRAAMQRSHGSRVAAIAVLVSCSPMLLVSPVCVIWLIVLGVWLAASNTRHRLASRAADRLERPDAEATLQGDRLLVSDRRGQSEYWLRARELRTLHAVPTARALPPR